MRRVAVLLWAFVCAGLALATPARAADPASSSPAPAPDFDALVKKADQARIAGKWSVALKAYSDALEIRKDPLIAGRIGLVLVEFREYDVAASKLFSAIEKGAGVNDAERTRFFQAFLVAKNQTCRLDVTIAQNGAKFEVDGEVWPDDRREFWTFIKPGKHTLRVRLEGFEDETREIDATKGGQLDLAFSLRPVKPADEPEKQDDPPLPTRATEPPPPLDKPAVAVMENSSRPPANSPKKNGSFVVGLGAGFVFGATPTPAVGPHLVGAWRSRTWWEVGVDARVAWTFVKDERAPNTQFVTWSTMIVPCGRWKMHLFGCGLVELDGVQRIGATKGRLLPGFGVRAGLEFETRRWMSLQFIGDVVFHKQGFEWQIPELSTSSSGSFVTGTVGIRALFMP